MWMEGTRKPSCWARFLRIDFTQRQELTSLLNVDQRHQAHSHFEHEFVELKNRIHGIRRRPTLVHQAQQAW